MTSPTSYTWQGVARWGCPYCAWDNGVEDNVVEHIRLCHAKADAAASSRVKYKPTRVRKPTDSDESSDAVEDAGTITSLDVTQEDENA